ncbi:uncharacterized protein LTR77_007054 [Saxophila tyrrhenica]|uniref:Uncharacterized protein n=1 Tax=Saxophila tyrrhenica TaxID=1690608 RepID=A0AAV9P4B4_9PEZI|nr:hypothetical protein LTR77_007054 [Saxophila tyrrhenica]
MPPSRQPADPFSSQPPLQPTTSNSTSLRSQTSQHSLRSNASSASTRPRQPNNLFAPSLSRRPTSRATPRVDDEVLADSDSEQDLPVQTRQRQLRRTRHGSPEGKQNRQKPKQEDELEFVNRQPDGSYLLGVSGYGEATAVPQIGQLQTEDEADQAELDAHYVSVARQYFSSGAALGERSGSKKHEEADFEQLRLPMMMRLREQVMQQLEEERWRYEPLDRF